ncbi:hypothetical protein D3C72_1603180 [compost metagenome]
MDDAVDQPESEQEDRQHEVVHAQVRRQVDQAEQPASRNVLHAVLAAGERRLQEQEVEHLCQGKRDHREVDALPANSERPHDKARGSRDGRAEQQAEFGGQPPGLHAVARYIGRRAEERRMAERQQAGIAEQQVKGAGEQGEAQHLHQHHRIEHRRGPQRAQQQDTVAKISHFHIRLTFPCQTGLPAEPSAQ